MGWASGRYLAFSIIDIIEPFLSYEDKSIVFTHIFECFLGEDCDTLDEVVNDKNFDDGLRLILEEALNRAYENRGKNE